MNKLKGHDHSSYNELCNCSCEVECPECKHQCNFHDLMGCTYFVLVGELLAGTVTAKLNRSCNCKTTFKCEHVYVN